MAGSRLILGGYVAFAGSPAELLLDVLPPIVHIREPSDRAAMRWFFDRLHAELRDPQPGGSSIAQQLATTLVVQALRLHLAANPSGSTGWLFALADRQVRAALLAMHEHPARRWRLQALAERAGMSRTAFAVRFRRMAGQTPMAYLTRWRMLLAADRLRRSGDPVSAVARSLGYESESAFSSAFSRVMGCSPRQHGRRHRGLIADVGRGSHQPGA